VTVSKPRKPRAPRVKVWTQEALDGRPDPGRVAIYGRSGSGKSLFAKRMIESLPRVVVFDPQAEYGHGPGWSRVDTVDAVRLAMRAAPLAHRIAYAPREGDEVRRLDALASLFVELGNAYRDGAHHVRHVLLVEELSMSFKLHSGETGAPKFAALCSRGRARGVGVIGVSQRPQEVSPRFRGNLSRIVAFSQAGDKEAAATVQNMPGVTGAAVLELLPHEFISMELSTLEVVRDRNKI
jgi:DNA helicase HerA-like ATPase